MLSALSSSSMFAFNGLFGTGQAVRYVFEKSAFEIAFSGHTETKCTFAFRQIEQDHQLPYLQEVHTEIYYVYTYIYTHILYS